MLYEQLIAGGLPPATALDFAGIELETSMNVWGAPEFDARTLSVRSVHVDVENGFEKESFYRTSPVRSPFLFWSPGGRASSFFSLDGTDVVSSTFTLSYDVTPTTPGHGFDAARFALDPGFIGPFSLGEALELDVLIEAVGGGGG